MPDLLLHHFDWSPYAEKVRVLLGIKQLAWRSVQIPMIMPKPELTALTGGYRKTPVLQIGADIYCDTQLIARELESRFPEPSLFPSGDAGLGVALSTWADRFFEPGAGLSMSGNAELPEDLLRDRREFFSHMDFASFATRRPHMAAQVLAYATLVEDQLSDGRPYLTGAHAALVDATTYYVFWMLRGFVPALAERLAPLRHVEPWEQRVRAIGHGERTEITGEEALAIARRSKPEPPRGVSDGGASGLRAGQRVAVTPDDYGKVPVTGELVGLDARRVSVRRHDERAGEVVVHFPRIGYVVEAA
jgi:glutathione S-transferase